MTEHLPAIIVAVPLLAALIVTVVWWFNDRLCFPLSVAAGLVVCGASANLFQKVLTQGVIEYRLGGWPPPVGIVFRVDHLNGLILVVVTLVAFLNLVASRRSAEKEFQDKVGAFYALFLLFITGLFGILITGDAFNLFVLLEIASLTGYALIGTGSGRASLSGLNYLLMGTIGASLYLFGVGILYVLTGSLNMVDIAGILPNLWPSSAIVLAFLLCMGGLFVKMALFPLHAWLPNAYTHAPSVVSSLVAPLTTKVMIYAMMRVALTVFTFDFAFNQIAVRGPILWLAILAIVGGSLMALSQRRLKKMLAYIVVAEVGYMVGGFWLGNKAGMSGAVLHIINDAVMTLCVFLAAAAITIRTGDDRLSSLRGMFKRMPLTMAVMVLGGLSLIGVPPTCGFFSKWYLISGGIEAGHLGFVMALIISSLVNVVLFFRCFEIGYFEPFMRGGEPHSAPVEPGYGAPTVQEAPVEMLFALLTTALLLLLLGLFSGQIVTRVIHQALPAVLG
ncbi:MAG: monovalent cation/H+ antiporter subunit D family protein [Desulfofustis sp.]|nr:monovalent cation/H+ antiporter subunit D family protein [Desulfofustis sp.]